MTALPEEVLGLVAATVRAARKAKGWTQARLAGEAGVSLAQLGLFEKGRNVSVQFLAKVAGALDLTLSLSAGGAAVPGLDPLELIRKTDALAVLVHDLRAFAMGAAAKSADQPPLRESAAVRAFVERTLSNERGLELLAEAMFTLSTESNVPRRAKAPAAIRGTRKRSRRSSER